MADIFKIDGLKEVEDALRDLPLKMQASVYRALNRKLVKKYIVDNIRNAVHYSNQTEKGITVITDRDDPTAMFGGVLSKVYWIRFADRGTAVRTTQKGANRGQIIGKNVIQPAIFNNVDEIIKVANNEIGTMIKDILEKRIKSVNKQRLKL